MGIKELEFANEQMEQLIELRLEMLRAEGVHPKSIIDVCQLYRRRGCGLLLANSDTEGFFQELHLAADTFLQLLERAQRRPGLDPYYLSRGHAEPLLDALAIGSVELVQRMDALLETRWQEGLEYPEDFEFFRLLPRLVSPATAQAELLEGVERMEQVLERAAYPRFEVLEALVHADARAFEEGLLAALDAWQAAWEQARKSGTGNPLGLVTDAHVFVEGIALVRVARARGIRTRSQYPFIPPLTLSAPPSNLQRQPIWWL